MWFAEQFINFLETTFFRVLWLIEWCSKLEEKMNLTNGQRTEVSINTQWSGLCQTLPHHSFPLKSDGTKDKMILINVHRKLKQNYKGWNDNLRSICILDDWREKDGWIVSITLLTLAHGILVLVWSPSLDLKHLQLPLDFCWDNFLQHEMVTLNFTTDLAFRRGH